MTKKFKNFKEPKNTIKGVTLIALVITIIVLLILSAITIITLIGDEGILNQATNAKDETSKENAKEQIKLAIMGSYNNDGKMEDDKLKQNLNKIPKIEGVPEGEINYPFDVTLEGYIFTIRSNGDTELDSRPEIKIGDYIDYTPDLNEDGSRPIYSKENLAENKTGCQDNDNIEQETLQWQVLRKYEDGSMDIIGTPTTKMIYFKGATGYNYGIDIINDVCETLYSKPSEGIKARSVNIEDFEYWLTDKGNNIKNSYSDQTITYGNNKTYYTNNLYPNLYQYEKGAGINKTEVNKQGLELSDKTNKLPEEQKNSLSNNPTGQASEDGLTATQTSYTITLDETNFGKGKKALVGNDFWIASRCVSCFVNYANWCFFRNPFGNGIHGARICNYANYPDVAKSRFRPVVHVESNVQIEVRDGSTSDNAHKLIFS